MKHFGLRADNSKKSPLKQFFTRVPASHRKVREICFSFKARVKPGNSVKWSGKLENLQKSGKSQEILKSLFVQSIKTGRN